MDWHTIRPINGNIQHGFEEFVSQLAKREIVPSDAQFIRNGTPDAGCECYCILTDNTEFAWQAKYFTSSLGDSQFQQIESSINTVMEKHPKLVKYYIAIPLDPPDGRDKKKKSMRGKWNTYLKKWQQLYPQVEFISWWSSDMISMLQKPENVSFLTFWFNKEIFTLEWFNRKVEEAILDLGVRYTPEINVELDICKIFDGIAADDRLKKRYEEKLDELLKKIAKLPLEDVIFNFAEIKNLSASLEKNFLDSSERLNFRYIRGVSEKLNQQIGNIYIQLEQQRKKENKNENILIERDEYSAYRYFMNEIWRAFYDFKNFINSKTVQLYDNPYLLIYGEAGSGKSHLLADIVNNRAKEGKFSLFLLGQKFKSCSNPRIQILEELDLKCNFDELLTSLECIAEINKSRVIIFIDAINEGKGKSIWLDNLNSFIAEIKRHQNLGLVLSLRSTYLPIFKDNVKDLIHYEHEGFLNNEDIATRQFFAYYEIEMPKIPILYPEFSNPLFLTLFCKGLKNKGLCSIPEGSHGISQIFDTFINTLNTKILGTNASLNIVPKSINALIEYEIENDTQSIPYDKAAEIILSIQNRFLGSTENLLPNFISEGLLIKDCNNKGEEFVDISYERLKDYLVAQYILENGLKINRIISKRLLYCPSYYQGVIDALAILLPETQSKEIFEILKNKRIESNVAEAFIKSLAWRQESSIKDENKIINYINKVAMPCHADLFWSMIISCAVNPAKFFNADRIHKNLMKHSMAIRDSFWLKIINKMYENRISPVTRLLDWALTRNDKSYITDASIELSITIIGWFLVSSNRTLRDRATKAITYLLKDRPHLILGFLKKFEDVNDPYVFERIYAAVYGVVLHTNNDKYLADIALYIYGAIFDKDKIYPHVLLRDYARNIIEYGLSKGVDLSKINLKNIKPPYRSDFPNIPSDDEIASYGIDYAQISKDKKLCGIMDILKSMRPEYTRQRQVNHYGDFGRYIFQSNFCKFCDNDKNKTDFIMDLHNIAIHRIFELGYSADLHGEYDYRIQSEGSYNRSPSKKERIGKKYQWIAMYELLAQVSDKYKIKDEADYKYFEGPWELYVRDIDPTNLGIIYEPQINLSIEYNNWEEDYTKWLKNTKDLPNPKKALLDSSKEWIILDGIYDWEAPKTLGKERFTVPTEKLFYLVKSYFVKNEQYDDVIKWLSKQNVGKRWLPEKGCNSQVFNREYVWSPAHDFFHGNPYYEGEDRADLFDKQKTDEYEKITSYQTSVTDIQNDKINDVSSSEVSKKINIVFDIKPIKRKKIKSIKIGEVSFTISQTYTWDKEYDFTSNDNCKNIRKPSFDLFNYFKLVYKEYDNCLYTEDGNLACFNKNGILYFRKKLILQFLKKNNLRLIWTILGEKNIIGNYETEKDNVFRQTLSGVYSLADNEDIIGDYQVIIE